MNFEINKLEKKTPKSGRPSCGNNESKRKTTSAITVIGRRVIDTSDPKCDQFLQNPVLGSPKSNPNSFFESTENIDGVEKKSDFIIQVLGISPRSNVKSSELQNQIDKQPIKYLHSGKLTPKVHKKENKDTNEQTKVTPSIREIDALKEIKKISTNKIKSATLTTGELTNKNHPSGFSGKPFMKKPFDYKTKNKINNSTELENIVFYTKESRKENDIQNSSTDDCQKTKTALDRNPSSNKIKDRLVEPASTKPSEELDVTHASISPVLMTNRDIHSPAYDGNNDFDNLSDVINNSVTALVSTCLQKLGSELHPDSIKNAGLPLDDSDERELLHQPMNISYNNYVDESNLAPFIAQRGTLKNGGKSASMDDAAIFKSISENEKFIRSTNRVIDISNATKWKAKSATLENRIPSIFDDLSLSQSLRKGALKALNNPKQPTEALVNNTAAMEIVPKKKCTAVDPILSASIATELLNQNIKLPSIKNSKPSITPAEGCEQEIKHPTRNSYQRNPSFCSIASTLSMSSKINRLLSKATLTLHDEKEEAEGDDRKNIELISEATNVPKMDADSHGIIDFEHGNKSDYTKSNQNLKNSHELVNEEIQINNNYKIDDKEIEQTVNNLRPEILNAHPSSSIVNNLEVKVAGADPKLKVKDLKDKNSIDVENEFKNISYFSKDTLRKEPTSSIERITLSVGETLDHLKLGSTLVGSNEDVSNIQLKISQNSLQIENFELTQLAQLNENEIKDNILRNEAERSLKIQPCQEPQINESSNNSQGPQGKKTSDYNQEPQISESSVTTKKPEGKESSNKNQDIQEVMEDDLNKDSLNVETKPCSSNEILNNKADEEFDQNIFTENRKNLKKLKNEFSSENSELEYESDYETSSMKEDESSLIDSIYLKMPLSLNDVRDCDSQSSVYNFDNESFLGDFEEDKWDKYSENEEEELANALHKFIEVEGIDYDLYERYLDFLKQRENENKDVCKNDQVTSRASNLMSSNHGSTISLPCSLQFCSCCEEELRAKDPRKDQCDSKLLLGLSNGALSRTEKAPGSQSEQEKEACGTATKSIHCDDPKSLLTILPSSEPQVTVVHSQLINHSSSLQDVRGEESSRTPKGESEQVQRNFHVDYIHEKKDLVLHSQPLKNPGLERKDQELKSPPKKRDKVRKKKELSELASRESLRSKIPVRVGSDMLARFGQSRNNNVYPVNNSYVYPANYAPQIKTPQRLPPIGRTETRNQNLRGQPVKARSKNMVFDFLNPFKRNHNSRGKWGRGPISVKPSPIKPQKGYEYEDLNNKRKLAPEKRRNSAGKIYIQDPNDKYNILVAEEIGYVYGDIRKNIAPVKQHKVERGMQTAEVKEAAVVKNGVLKNNQSNQKSVNNKKKPNLPPPKKGAKNEPVVSFVMDLHAASKLETPREKGDYVIYSSRNLPKLKSKNVSFKEAERGVKSISSTIPEHPKERLYANRRDVAIDLPPPHFYDPRHRNYYKPAPVVGPPKGFGYSNGGLPASRAAPPKPALERRASFDGKLPPVIGRSRSEIPGQFFNQIHHASSQPNLSQNTHNSFLPPKIAPNHDSPLRTFDDPIPQAASAPIPGKGTRKGWGRVKQLTMKSKDDTTIDMPYESTTDLLQDMPGRRAKGPAVPIVLLQGFFKGGPKPNQNNGKPPENQKVSIPKTLLEPNSLLRGALPVLPTYLAAICLMFNIFVPGLGTLLSGWFGYCAGRTRLGPDEKSSHRLTSVIITAGTGFVQLFTVTFFLVGWFWSISWGIILVSVARRYKKFMVEHRASMAKKVSLNMLTVNAA